MQQINDSSKRLIQQLQPKVSGFSHSFQLTGKNNDEVVCGGKIKQINDMNLLSDEENADIIYVTIDDVIGELLILIPGELWRNLNVKKDDLILAEGILHSLRKECTFQSKAGVDIVIARRDEPMRVLVKKVERLDA
ncbi:DNA-binding protein [Cytobacillus horneckiae]|uniref:DNA-binding protein n=1 Tax=Cytobacillus horneckiae TaxID=549687 RepID=UPI0034CE3C66